MGLNNLNLAEAVLLAKVIGGGGSGPSITVSPLSVTSNGTYSAAAGTAYSPVEVDVPNSYTASDEGRVVSNGALVPQTSSAITSNGTVDTTLINSVEVNVSGGGGSDAEDTIVMRTISEYTNSRVTEVGQYAFASCVALTAVSFPTATSIGSYAFASCSSLATVSFPTATTVGASAFAYCSSLTTVSFPAVTSIGTNAFASCYSLTTATFPVATSIGNNAFASCSNLTTVSFPTVTKIGNSTFYRCFRLISLYLAGSSVVGLSNSNAFTSTPIGGYSASAGQYGSIYVPSSLLASYQSATNWTYFSSRFVGI